MTDFSHIEKLIEQLNRFPRFLPSGLETDEVATTMRQMLEVVRAAKLIVDSTANYETFADPDFVYSAEKALAKLEASDE